VDLPPGFAEVVATCCLGNVAPWHGSHRRVADDDAIEADSDREGWAVAPRTPPPDREAELLDLLATDRLVDMASEQTCPTARHSFRGSATALATLRPVADPNVMHAKQRSPCLLHLERPSRSAVADVDAHRDANRLTTRFKSIAPFWTSTGGYLALVRGLGTERPHGPDFSTRRS
jgi:hypothetical protein